MRFFLCFLTAVFWIACAKADDSSLDRVRAALALSLPREKEEVKKEEPKKEEIKMVPNVGHDLSWLPQGSVEIKEDLFQIPGGCLWGTYRASYEEALRTNKPMMVHIGKRLEGLCHAGSHDKWLHTLTDEFMGHREGVSVLVPRNGNMDARHFSAASCSVATLMADANARMGQSMQGFSTSQWSSSMSSMPMMQSAPMMRSSMPMMRSAPMMMRGGFRGRSGGSC